MQRYC